MKGLVISSRDKLMFTMVNTLILFVGIIATVTLEDPVYGLMLILFDFLLAVIVLLAASPADESAQNANAGQIVHQGRYPAGESEAPAATPAPAEASAPTTDTPPSTPASDPKA